MTLFLRFLLIVFSILAAYYAGLYAERFTLVPLRPGRFEANPATILVFFAGFVVVLTLLLVVGNILLNRYFRLSRKG